eukprot:COSAG06_NODE_56394_length_285_cov_0.532258_1_plen_20_part_01
MMRACALALFALLCLLLRSL